jgi:hypothetical protein
MRKVLQPGMTGLWLVIAQISQIWCFNGDHKAGTGPILWWSGVFVNGNYIGSSGGQLNTRGPQGVQA